MLVVPSEERNLVFTPVRRYILKPFTKYASYGGNPVRA